MDTKLTSEEMTFEEMLINIRERERIFNQDMNEENAEAYIMSITEAIEYGKKNITSYKFYMEMVASGQMQFIRKPTKGR